MNLKQYNYILTIAKEKSFTKASKKLFIAQSSLSQYVQRIESELNTELFNRSTNPLELTYAGEVFVKHAEKIIGIQETMLKDIENINNLQKGKVVIGTSFFRSETIINKVLPIFLERYPEIEIILQEKSTQEINTMTQSGQVDFSITTLPVDESIFDYEIIKKEAILLALPQNHKIVKSIKNKEDRPLIDIRELFNERFILGIQTQSIRQYSDKLFSELKIKPKSHIESMSIYNRMTFVEKGLGVTFIPETYDYNPKDIKKRPVLVRIKDFENLERKVAVVYKKGAVLSKASNAFISTLKEIYM